MKKMLCLCMILLMALSLCACGDKEEPIPATAAEPAATVTAEPVPVTEAPATPEPVRATPEPAPVTAEPAVAVTAEPAPIEETSAQETEPAAGPAYYVTEADCAPVDVDLTPLSITMLYAQTVQMNYSPDEYIGKRVKTVGQFAFYPMTDQNGNPSEDQGYFVCLVNDATACCSAGLEFILKGDPKYPEDFPKQNSIITIAGEFQTYMEGDYRYCHLVDAEFITK